MAVYSMTGYASVSSTPAEDAENPPSPSFAAGAVTVELRSVNGRFLDLALRLPDEVRPLEPALRELVAGAVRRGKVELRVSTQRDAESAWPNPQPDQLNRLSRLESTVQGWLPHAAPLSVHEVMQWCRNAAPAERLDEVVLDAARRAVAQLREARAREGSRLASILMERVEVLRALAARAKPLLPAAIERQQQRFVERWNEALESVGAGQTVSREALHERAINEAAAYAVRIDVAEELARLGAHLDEITRLLDKGGEVGKRLEFLIQELLREANTLGSKSSTLELTSVSVEMKVAIEQLREQIQNVE